MKIPYKSSTEEKLKKLGIKYSTDKNYFTKYIIINFEDILDLLMDIKRI